MCVLTSGLVGTLMTQHNLRTERVELTATVTSHSEKWSKGWTCCRNTWTGERKREQEGDFWLWIMSLASDCCPLVFTHGRDMWCINKYMLVVSSISITWLVLAYTQGFTCGNGEQLCFTQKNMVKKINKKKNSRIVRLQWGKHRLYLLAYKGRNLVDRPGARVAR